MKSRKHSYRIAAITLMLCLFLGMLSITAEAISPIRGGRGYVTLEKHWDDQDDALGLRPESVTYDLYMYQGEWTGTENAQLIFSDIVISEDSPLYRYNWETGRREFIENAWQNDEVVLDNLSYLGKIYDEKGVRELDESLPTELTYLEDGEYKQYQFKYVEHVPEGYVEVESTDAELLLSDFRVGEAVDLEEIAPNEYRIPNFQEFYERIDELNRNTDMNGRLSKEDIPVFFLQRDGKTYVIALQTQWFQGDIVSRNSGIEMEELLDYLEKNYGDYTIRDFGDTAVSIDNLPFYETHEAFFSESYESQYGFEIEVVDGGKEGILRILPSIEKISYDNYPNYTVTEVSNPFYVQEGEEGLDSAKCSMVTPTNRYGLAAAVSVNKLKEPVDVTVTKVWKDDEEQEGPRPTEVEVNLLANGKIKDTQTLSEENEWTYTWSDLPDYETGVKLEYTVEEAGVPEGYSAEVEKTNEVVETGENGLTSTSMEFTITNTLKPEEEPEEPGEEDSDKKDESTSKDELEIEDEKTDKSPNTGDTAETALFGLLLALSAGGILVVSRKRSSKR